MSKLSRRTILNAATGGLCVAGLGALIPGRAATLANVDVVARSQQTSLGRAVRPFDRWTYDTGTTNSIIRGQFGETIQANFLNRLDAPTTVHWHGLRVSKGMDGVSGKFGSPLVQPGETFEYQVPLRDPGTHWYHSHHDSLNQIARGLYGLLIVENPQEPSLFEQVLVFDDWTVMGPGRGNYEINWTKLEPSLAWGHDGVKGRVLTINGTVNPRLELAFEGATRLRMLNAATGRVFRPSFENARAWVVAMDGYTCQPFELSEPLFFGPGQRLDVLLEPAGLGRTQLFLGENLFGKGTGFEFGLGLESSGALAETLPGFTPYAPAELQPELRASQRVTLDMSELYRDHPEGAGKVKGEWQDWDSLVNSHRYWLFNDVADNSLGPLFTGRVGETVEVDFVNNSATHHVMHFHGQHVKVKSSTSASHEIGNFRDSITFEAWPKATIAMKLDRPGLRPLHCHILGHQVSGMFTYYEVT